MLRSIKNIFATKRGFHTTTATNGWIQVVSGSYGIPLTPVQIKQIEDNGTKVNEICPGYEMLGGDEWIFDKVVDILNEDGKINIMSCDINYENELLITGRVSMISYPDYMLCDTWGPIKKNELYKYDGQIGDDCKKLLSKLGSEEEYISQMKKLIVTNNITFNKNVLKGLNNENDVIDSSRISNVNDLLGFYVIFHD